MNSGKSRRSFLSAVAAMPAAAVMPSQAIAGAVATPVMGTGTALPLIKMAFNRFSVLGVLDALTGVMASATKIPPGQTACIDASHGREARQIRQISDLMRHTRDLGGKGISFSDFSRESLMTWQNALNGTGETGHTSIQDAFQVLEALYASGCRNWQDVTRVMLGKALPLVRGLERSDFLSRAKECGNDGGVLGAIDHISRECEAVLGADFQPYKTSLNNSLLSLNNGWKDACAEIIQAERERQALRAFSATAPETTAKRISTPGAFRANVDVEPLFLPMKSSAFFFRIIPRSGSDVNFIDLCRISHKLTTGGKLPVSCQRLGGKKGFVISTEEPKLVSFLFACTSASTRNNFNLIPS